MAGSTWAIAWYSCGACGTFWYARLRVGPDAERPGVPMLASARGLAEIISDKKTQIVNVQGFDDFFNRDIAGIDVQIWLFALVSVAGWVLLNRTTFGRRTVAVGGNPEAARLAGINVKLSALPVLSFTVNTTQKPFRTGTSMRS